MRPPHTRKYSFPNCLLSSNPGYRIYQPGVVHHRGNQNRRSPGAQPLLGPFLDSVMKAAVKGPDRPTGPRGAVAHKMPIAP